MTLKVGENVGPYRVVEQLGQGGMATVFKAYHPALDRYVAIKVLHAAFKEDPTFLARFQREARVVAKLEHPNIVPVYDFADHEGAPYLVMKFIEGETLKAQMSRAPLALGDVWRITEAVGAGLAFAHTQGILHRDIKPSNVMMAKDGNIYLADFGLARIALAGESTLSMDSMLGTPHYMSPEQAKGVKDLDAGADIYSFGVMLYEMVVGRVPYSADTPFAIIHDHIFTPLPLPHTLNPNIPDAVERALLKALAKERADRYADAATMVLAFREALTPLLDHGTLSRASTVLAYPRPVPVAPTADTAASTTGSAPKIAPPAAEPTLAARPAASAQTGYQFQWWHAVAGLVVLAVLVGGAFGAGRFFTNRQANATATAIAEALPTDQPPPPLSPPPGETMPPPPPPGNGLESLFNDAQQAFANGDLEGGLALLDQAVAQRPEDNVLSRAGEITLRASFARPALEKYYLPLVTPAQLDNPRAIPWRANAALAFYAIAPEKDSLPLIESQLKVYPEPEVVAFAFQRYRLWNMKSDNTAQELENLAQQAPNSPGVLILQAEFALGEGRLADAEKFYQQVLDLRPGGRTTGVLVPDWVRREVDCNLKRLAEQGAAAKPVAVCSLFAELVQGPGLQIP